MKQNGLLNLSLKQVLDFFEEPSNEWRFVSSELGLIWLQEKIQKKLEEVLFLEQPFRLTEGRVIYLSAGFVRVRINLREVTLTPHHLAVASPGTAIQFIEMSPDCKLVMFACANSFMENWRKEKLLMEYMQGRLFFILPLRETDEKRLDAIFSLMWDVFHDIPFPKETVQSMVSMLFHQIAAFRERNLAEEKPVFTRQEEVFNRFLSLVNKYAVKERSIAFYAGRLYLTPRYLSTLIKQTSGRTVMEWVNEAVIQEAKLQLYHSGKLVYQIADELNFPNASFFCKFFRRMTGKTPNEYRQKFGSEASE